MNLAAPLMLDAHCDDLNAAVALIPSSPRVRFEVGITDDAERWIKKKHADGAVHEPGTIAAFIAARKWIGPEAVVFDVGALFGYFSVLAAMMFEGKLVAFEMHPGAIPSLKLNIWPFGEVVQTALSDHSEAGVLTWVSGFNIFEKPAGGWEALKTEPGAMKERGDGNRGRGYKRINFRKLDDWCASSAILPNLIKFDVEAYQAKALCGALLTITAARPVVIIELHDPEKTARLGTTNAATVQPLFDLGYKAYWCGNFRAAEAHFEPVAAMGPEHERLSLMVFVP